MKKSFLLQNLCCANCAAKIERKVQKIKGVNSATVNFMTTRMNIECEDSALDSVINEAEKIVKKIEPDVVMKAL